MIRFKNSGAGRQYGLSMIELLLAMLLSLFVIGGLGAVYISSKQTYALRDQISEMDGNARIALYSLKRHIAHAGYNTSGQKINNYILPTGTDIASGDCIKSGGSIESAENNVVIDRQNNIVADSIGMSFIADQHFHASCMANGASFIEDNPQCIQPNAPDLESSRFYNSFSISKGSKENSVGDLVPELRCGSSTWHRRESIAKGIENMQLRYGVDTDADQKVDRYLNAQEVNDQGLWDAILLVQVGLLVRSVEPAFPESQSMTYQVLDEEITTEEDRYKRAVYTTVIRLRNVANPLL